MQKFPKVSVLGYVVDTKGNKLINNSSGSPISETVAICLKDNGEVITVLPTHIKFVSNDAVK